MAQGKQMPQISAFEAYGILAQQCEEVTQLAGRYFCQKGEEKNIVLDIVHKLELSCQDACFELGCGAGNLLIPLSFMVRSCTGVDHGNVIARFKQRFTADNVTLIAADFFSLDREALGQFDKIIVYSVLQCFESLERLELIVDYLLALLKPGGLLLLGDLPNEDKKQRFLDSPAGKDFSQLWQEKMRQEKMQQEKMQQENSKNQTSKVFDLKKIFTRVNPVLEFNDKVMSQLMQYICQQGCESYLLPQPDNLPFCFSREDILVRKY